MISLYPVEIRGERVTLREFRAEDLAAVHRYGGDAEVTRFTTWGPNDEAESRRFLRWAMDEARRPRRVEYQLAIETEGYVVGGAGLHLASGYHRAGEIGYVLQRDRWGRGFGREAARLLLRFGFEELGMHRIAATCDPRNDRSRRVIEAVGMQLEGRLRENFRTCGGWRDSLLFSMLRQEYDGMAE